MTTTTKDHTSRGHRRHLANLERQSRPIPEPGHPPSGRLAASLDRAQRPHSPGNVVRSFGGPGRRGHSSYGATTSPWRRSLERLANRRAKLARRRNRR